ncbi:zinc-ribbon and DUF3426 domain-containing protein [Methylocucumis oryzae]|uniref:zinc-ribbon and DUF3426 domain-containing protein n=1 Tax=Methylocucumis oryzae TaxID=1632867 RepID=UPI0006971676|nr:zinc-ribbon and DUF3426 domain-containing protein [Methylocucumis oryzae]
MYTRCPNCRQPQTVSAEQLSQTRALLYCRHCEIKFDALELLSETPDDAARLNWLKAENTDLPWEKPTQPYWLIGVFIASALLIAQGLYFESARLTQNSYIRPSLEWVCTRLNCILPRYNNTAEFVVNSEFTEAGEHFLLTVQLSNNAGFAQDYPLLKLRFMDYNGNPFAQRLLSVHDYAPNAATTVLTPGASVVLSLAIARPANKVGGYTLDIQS